MVPLLLKFGEFVTFEQEAVPWHAREDLVLQTEVSHRDHWEGFPTVKIKEQLPAWHGDPRAVKSCTGHPRELSGGSHYISTCGPWSDLHAGARCSKYKGRYIAQKDHPWC